MPEGNSKLKIFLCHSSADKPKVRELYRYLKRRDLQPWLDEEERTPSLSVCQKSLLLKKVMLKKKFDEHWKFPKKSQAAQFILSLCFLKNVKVQFV